MTPTACPLRQIHDVRVSSVEISEHEIGCGLAIAISIAIRVGLDKLLRDGQQGQGKGQRQRRQGMP